MRFTPEQVSIIRKAAKEGKRPAEIARMLGLRQSSFRQNLLDSFIVLRYRGEITELAPAKPAGGELAAR